MIRDLALCVYDLDLNPYFSVGGCGGYVLGWVVGGIENKAQTKCLDLGCGKSLSFASKWMGYSLVWFMLGSVIFEHPKNHFC